MGAHTGLGGERDQEAGGRLGAGSGPGAAGSLGQCAYQPLGLWMGRPVGSMTGLGNWLWRSSLRRFRVMWDLKSAAWTSSHAGRRPRWATGHATPIPRPKRSRTARTGNARSLSFDTTSAFSKSPAQASSSRCEARLTSDPFSSVLNTSIGPRPSVRGMDRTWVTNDP